MNNQQVINGNEFYYMLRVAFTSLSFNESYLNDINTFPVSDSDTGTNMKRTFMMGLNSTNENETAGKIIQTLAENMSLSSRGNSGFILSQYFRGLSECLKNKTYFTLDDFKEAIVHAYQVAYASVINPIEGTMLTVMREGAQKTLNSIKKLKNCTFFEFFNTFSEHVFESVIETKKQMKLLISNNVVDSGALGFYLIVDGMKKYFNDDVPYFNCHDSVLLPKRVSDSETALTFFRYCTEYIISLKEKHKIKFFSNILFSRGDSVAIALDNDLLKVHVHTNEPYSIIDIFKSFGTLVSSKVDDLFITPEFERLKRRKHEDYAVVAFTYGNQSATLFERLGVDAAFPIPFNLILSEGGIKKLLEPYLDENLIVYSVDKKIEDIIRSIAHKDRLKNIVVVDCKGVSSAFYKLASSMFDGTFEDFKNNLYLLDNIKTTEFYLKKNEPLKKQLNIYLSKNRVKGFSTMVIFGGREATEEDINIVYNFLSQYEDIEVSFYDSGQDDPFFIIGAM